MQHPARGDLRVDERLINSIDGTPRNAGCLHRSKKPDARPGSHSIRELSLQFDTVLKAAIVFLEADVVREFR